MYNVEFLELNSLIAQPHRRRFTTWRVEDKRRTN